MYRVGIIDTEKAYTSLHHHSRMSILQLLDEKEIGSLLLGCPQLASSQEPELTGHPTKYGHRRDRTIIFILNVRESEAVDPMTHRKAHDW